MNKNDAYIWFPDPVHCFLLGEIIDRNETSGKIKIRSAKGNLNAGEEKTFDINQCKDWDPSHTAEHVCDVSKCSGMTEAPMLDILRRRFLKKEIYTYVADIVIAINPYKDYPSLTTIPDPLKTFQLGEDPHVWAIGDFAYRSMMDEFSEMRNQSVIVSGESGAGKTYACKYVNNYLTKLSERQTKKSEQAKGRRTSITKIGIEEKILACNPFLEAFGNAKTTRNDNSSRFGKYTKILYHEGRIMGAVMEDYLLEKARVVGQLDGDRNFHIFYFLLKGATDEERKMYHLMEPEKYRYLNNVYIKVKNESDDDNFQEVRKCLQNAEVDEETQQAMWKTLSGVLLLGNIKFIELKKPDDEEYHIKISNPNVAKDAAEMLGIDFNVLKSMLKKRVIPAIMAGEDDIQKPYVVERFIFFIALFLPLSIYLFSSHSHPPFWVNQHSYETSKEAVNAVDALAKEIYARMFKSVVHAVNETLSPDKDHMEAEFFIGILDIFGFEIFVENSFEQLLINYANEMLQNLFNEHVFKNEAKIYEDEGISIEHIEFPDNQPCVELIDGDYKHCKFTGILGQLDELTLRPVAKGHKPPSDKDFGKNLRKVFYDTKGLSVRGKEAKKRFRVVAKLNKFKGKHFWVNHFAGEVDYVTDGFINKNMDKVFPHLMNMMDRSKMKYSQNLFLTNWDTGKTRDPPSENDESSKKKKKKKKKRKKKSSGKTIGLKFKTALQGLAKTLRKTQPHYIRCVKPNDHKYTCDQGWKAFEGVKVKEQLLRAGVMETVKIRQSGFPVRREYDRAWEQYERMNLHNLVPSASRKMIREAGNDCRKKCVLLLSAIDDANGKWAEGKTKLFAKETLYQSIATWRRKHCADEVQDWYRYYDCQHRLHNFHCSMVYIQMSWRNVLIQRKYESMLVDIQNSQRVINYIEANAKFQKLKKQRMAIMYTQRWYRFQTAASQWYG